MVLTRFGLDEIESRLAVGRDAVWVNAGVLSDTEVSQLRGSGWDLTVWTNRLDPNDFASVIETVRSHHPGQVVWIEAAGGQPTSIGVKDQGPIQSGSRSSGGASSAGFGEGTLDVHDRSRLATIRDCGLREIAALRAHNRAFGEACNAYYASGKVAAPFESLNEEYWT